MDIKNIKKEFQFLNKKLMEKPLVYLDKLTNHKNLKWL